MFPAPFRTSLSYPTSYSLVIHSVLLVVQLAATLAELVMSQVCVGFTRLCAADVASDQ